MSDVSLRAITKCFGDQTVVDTLDLDVRKGEFLTLLGPSGCGKTTTLRMIAGFVAPTKGRVRIGGEDVTDLPPQKRQVGMVFQDYALFPHMTIAENIAFGLVERGTKREQIGPRVHELLELIRLPDVAHRMPQELSGGQQQRVALARAIAHPPRVLLMDEPLGALDLKMREHMQVELRRIQQDLGLTAVYVTHDQTEAMTMSDRIAVMNAGRIEQLDSPEVVYRRPRTRFVANFIGKVNFLTGLVGQGDRARSIVETEAGPVLCDTVTGPVGSSVTVAIRPEHLTIKRSPAHEEGMNLVSGRIAGETFCGNVRHYAVDVRGRATFLIETRPDADRWSPGEEVSIAWHARDGIVMAEASTS